MTDKRITVRLPGGHVEALERIAQRESATTGYTVRLSDVVRAAVRDYLAAQGGSGSTTTKDDEHE